MKPGGWMWYGSGKNTLYSGADLDQGTDCGIFLSVLNIAFLDEKKKSGI